MSDSKSNAGCQPNLWLRFLFGPQYKRSWMYLPLLFVPKLAFLGIFLLLLMPCIVLSIICHELGHAIAGKLVGFRPYELILGSGKTLWERHLFGVKVVVRMLLHAAFVCCDYPNVRLFRLRRFLLVLAGPLVNVTLLAVAVWGVFQTWHATNWWVSASCGLSMALLVPNFLFAVLAVWPKHLRVSAGLTQTDSLFLITTPFLSQAEIEALRVSSRYHSERRQQSERGKTGKSDSPDPTHPGSSEVVVSKLAAELISATRTALNSCPPGNSRRKTLLDDFVWTVILSGASELFDEADRYSEELVRLDPRMLTLKTTRGAILIEKGNLDEGMALLTEVYEKSKKSHVADKALSATFLAQAELKRGKLAEAENWLHAARRMNAEPQLLKRVERLFESAGGQLRQDPAEGEDEATEDVRMKRWDRIFWRVLAGGLGSSSLYFSVLVLSWAVKEPDCALHDRRLIACGVFLLFGAVSLVFAVRGSLFKRKQSNAGS